MLASRALVALLCLAVLLAACGNEEAAGDVAAPVPGSPTATADASSSPSPSPSPTPQTVVAPLTGQDTTDLDVLERPVLQVKIENSAKARPQAGLEDADIVFEELVEGGVTRFLAMFQSQLPAVVGPIRSARLVDAQVLPPFDGILAYSGARDEVEAALGRIPVVRLIEGRGGFFRDRSRPAPHNLFGDASELVATGQEVGEPAPGRSGFTFAAAPPPGATDCSGPDAPCDGTQLDVRMSNSSVAGWTYDAAAEVYRRAQNGVPQPTVSGVDVGAANVVVLGMQVGPGGCCDTSGARYVATTVSGQGRAIVLRDGRWYELTWRKAGPSDHLELVDADGVTFPLKPGPTWVHLAPRQNLPAAP